MLTWIRFSTEKLARTAEHDAAENSQVSLQLPGHSGPVRALNKHAQNRVFSRLAIRAPYLCAFIVLMAGLVLYGATKRPVAVVDILSSELERNLKILKEKGDPAPYFLAYAITEQQSENITAASGALVTNASSESRNLDVTVRVGTMQFDNYHRNPRDPAYFTSGAAVAIDNNPDSIKRTIWMETDRVYRLAVRRLLRLRTDQEVKVKPDDPSGDFSPSEVAQFSAPPSALQFNNKDWEKKVRDWSAMFKSYPEILNSNVAVSGQRETKYFVNSEGTKIEQGRQFARVTIAARGKHADGMDLFTSETFEAESVPRLPNDDAVKTAVTKAANDLQALLKAPETEPFVGPAILSGSSSGVFFHEIFGHRVEGHRQKDENEGQTFTKSVGSKVLPDFLSVIFDPTRHMAGGKDLYGWYDFDDEGVKGRKVSLVESGTLKTFLLSRSPIQGFPASNGHGRRQAGAEVVSRQSNLIVESSKQMSDKDLRRALLEEVKRQNKPYGLYFEKVTGGYTTTQRAGLQAFTVMPLMVYRVYPDGRPDELVRGADIVGTPLASFAKIIATSDKTEVFNGFCGAESGSVPVSAISPAILVSEIEVQKKSKARDLRPLLERPVGK